jgi:hypothetical protein
MNNYSGSFLISHYTIFAIAGLEITTTKIIAASIITAAISTIFYKGC